MLEAGLQGRQGCGGAGELVPGRRGQTVKPTTCSPSSEKRGPCREAPGWGAEDRRMRVRAGGCRLDPLVAHRPALPGVETSTTGLSASPFYNFSVETFALNLSLREKQGFGISAIVLGPPAPGRLSGVRVLFVCVVGKFPCEPGQ